MRNDACPIHVIQTWPPSTLGKSGMPFFPARLVKSDGMRTLVRKLRLCQSVPGLSPTVFTAGFAPFPLPWMTFRGLFFEKGIGTVGQPYKLGRVKQKLSPR